ncbi:MAG: SusC/RagA family TonB-linked outer membrane protein [Cyclobacteriaceae bacterium]
MKYIKILSGFVLIILCQINLIAQSSETITIKAQVLGAYGKPLADGVVASESNNLSVITNEDGTFQLEVPDESILSVSAPGYVTKFITAKAGMTRIELDLDWNNQDVKVAYRTVEESKLLGGVSHIDMEKLLKKNYITYTLSDMEGLVPGFHGNMWGNNDYLVIVDGVPRDETSVLPVEIDQISFLKGVSAVALYGSRAAKGAVLITTKRGREDENTINVRTNTGIHIPKRYPKFLGSAEYMTYYNEARLNDGENPAFSESTIYNYASGQNPYRYPNVDYYAPEYLQDVYSRNDATVEIVGGNERAKYYTNVGFYTEGSVLDFGKADQTSNNRFNVRGNVDINLHRNISAKVDAAAVYEISRGVSTNYWQQAATLRPYRYAPLIPISYINENDQASLNLVNNTENIIDGKYFLGGTQLDPTNPIADAYAGGDSIFNSRQFQFNTEVNADLSDLLKGLTFTTRFGIDYATSYGLGFGNEYATFAPFWLNANGNDELTLDIDDPAYGKFGQDASSGEQSINGSWYRQTTSISGLLNYRSAFSENHHFNALFVAGGFQIATLGQYHKTSNANLGLNLGYDFKNKYYAEFSGSLIHSARLPEDNRRAISPTASLGWRLSNEGFLSGSSVVNNLMLNVSAGILRTDLDIVNPEENGDDFYLYQNIYSQTSGVYYTWKDGLNNNSTDSRRGANPNMTFPQREEVSVGINAALFDNKVVFAGSAFASRMTGLIVQNDVLFPNYFTTGFPNSSFLPFVNFNEDKRLGFDYSLQVNQPVGEVDFTLGINGTYYTTEALKRAENYEYSYQNRQGNPLDALWGLENDGFFSDQTDIDNSPEQAFGEVKPGDIKYKDQNGDGLINAQDEVYLGKGGWFGSPFTMGLNLTAKWRNLTFFALGVLQTGGNDFKRGDYYWVNGEDKYSEVVRGRWTEQTKETATYPRLTVGNGNNNFRNSDFWLFSRDRFDLRRVQITYNFPQRIIGDKWFKELGVYVNGANLLTISPNTEILELDLLDVEEATAPQTRFFNLGVTAQF